MAGPIPMGEVKLRDQAAPSNRVENEEESPRRRRIEYISRERIKYIGSHDSGIDYLHLSFPILPPRLDLEDWRRVTTRAPGSPAITLGRRTFGRGPESYTLCVYKRRQHVGVLADYWCALEFNPARFVDPVGIGLCDYGDLKDVARLVIGMACRHVRPITQIEDFQVRRVDLAQNFYGVQDPARYICGLRIVPRPYATSTSIFFDSRTGRPETIMAGSKSGGSVRLYDKSAHRLWQAPPGTMRFEIEARQGWCQRLGAISTFDDLTEANLVKLRENRSAWFGLEAQVMTTEAAFERIFDDSETGTRVKLELAKFILDRLRGRQTELSSRTAMSYQRRLRDLGIAPFSSAEADFTVTRLDVESGTELQIA